MPISICLSLYQFISNNLYFFNNSILKVLHQLQSDRPQQLRHQLNPNQQLDPNLKPQSRRAFRDSQLLISWHPMWQRRHLQLLGPNWNPANIGNMWQQVSWFECYLLYISLLCLCFRGMGMLWPNRFALGLCLLLLARTSTAHLHQGISLGSEKSALARLTENTCL